MNSRTTSLNAEYYQYREQMFRIDRGDASVGAVDLTETACVHPGEVIRLSAHGLRNRIIFMIFGWGRS
jgi:hypothetical protein